MRTCRGPKSMWWSKSSWQRSLMATIRPSCCATVPKHRSGGEATFSTSARSDRHWRPQQRCMRRACTEIGLPLSVISQVHPRGRAAARQMNPRAKQARMAVQRAESGRWPESTRSLPYSPADVHLPHFARVDDKIVFRCSYHIVWCAQYRAPVLTDQVAVRLREIIAAVVIEKGAQLTGIEIAATHVHLRVEITPRFGIHRLVKAMKSRSASTLREEFPALRRRLPSLWTNSYLVTTVGPGTSASTILQYVKGQKTR